MGVPIASELRASATFQRRQGFRSRRCTRKSRSARTRNPGRHERSVLPSHREHNGKLSRCARRVPAPTLASQQRTVERLLARRRPLTYSTVRPLGVLRRSDQPRSTTRNYLQPSTSGLKATGRQTSAANNIYEHVRADRPRSGVTGEVLSNRPGARAADARRRRGRVRARSSTRCIRRCTASRSPGSTADGCRGDVAQAAICRAIGSCTRFAARPRC